MWLLNFNLQSKVISSNFSEKKFFILKFPIFRKIWSCVYSGEDGISSVFNFIWLSESQIKSFSPILLKLRSHLLYCHKRCVVNCIASKLGSCKNGNTSQIEMLNKMGPNIELCVTPEMIFFHELNLESTFVLCRWFYK